MNGKGQQLAIALGNAFVMVSIAALTIVLTASLLARAGMPFTAAYTGSILACIIGTLIASRSGRALLALPSPAVTAWLVYEEMISRGTSWQEMLGIAAVISILGALLMRTKQARLLTAPLPPIIRTGLVCGLGLAMLTTAALYARILLPSPWALTIGGMLSDPLTYYALTGILLVLILHAMHVRCALPLGMGIIAALTWLEGFWEIPAAPFLQPDLTPAALALTLPQPDTLVPAATLGMILLLTLAAESSIVLAAHADAKDPQTDQRTLARLFGASSAAALLGALPMSIAPVSAVLPVHKEERHIAGIPLTVCFSTLFLLLLVPCAPLLQAIADFPAAPAVALAVLGLMLLMQGLASLRHADESIGLRESAVFAAFLLAAFDIRTGLTAALLLWTLLTAARGERRRIPPSTGGLTALLLILALLKWIH